MAIALTWGGVQFAWTSARVLVPLVLGLCGIVFFFVYEATLASYPMVSPPAMSKMRRAERTCVECRCRIGC